LDRFIELLFNEPVQITRFIEFLVCVCGQVVGICCSCIVDVANVVHSVYGIVVHTFTNIDVVIVVGIVCLIVLILLQIVLRF